MSVCPARSHCCSSDPSMSAQGIFAQSGAATLRAIKGRPILHIMLTCFLISARGMRLVADIISPPTATD